VPDHLSNEQLAAFRARTLGPAELLAVDDHVASCLQCRAMLGDAATTNRAFAALRAQVASEAAADHPTYEQIERHVEGRSDEPERDRMNAHLDTCVRCADEVRDLAEFRAQRITPPTTSPARRTGHWPALPALVRWALVPAAAAAAVLAATIVFRGEAPQPAPSPRQAAASVSPLPAPVRVALADGGRRVTLDEAGRLAGLPAMSREDETAIRVALETGRVKTPEFLTGLVEKPGTLLGAANDRGMLRLVGPIGTAVETARPTLRWLPLKGASSYTAAVFDAHLDPVATSPHLSATEWTLSRPLPRGHDYTWQVVARFDDREVTAPAPPAPEARFRVLEESLATDVVRAREAYAGSHLALGLAYARAGLLDEAERELHALADLNPDSAEARGLLRQVQTLRSGR
jgi:hypothetical protein